MKACQEKCRGCSSLNYCEIRMHEWVKNIQAILSKYRESGEGQQMAEDAIQFMHKEFMGGIK